MSEFVSLNNYNLYSYIAFSLSLGDICSRVELIDDNLTSIEENCVSVEVEKRVKKKIGNS